MKNNFGRNKWGPSNFNSFCFLDVHQYFFSGSGVFSVEMIESGAATTPFMKYGDRVRIEMFDAHGQSTFGAIDQQVAASTRR